MRVGLTNAVFLTVLSSKKTKTKNKSLKKEEKEKIEKFNKGKKRKIIKNEKLSYFMLLYRVII